MSRSFSRCLPVPSSSSTLPSIRCYASKPSGGAGRIIAPDQRMDNLREILYPPNSHLPKSPAPSGSHHKDHLARIQKLVPNPEVYETIERAHKLFKRHEKRIKTDELRVKFLSMEKACDDLHEITIPKQGVEQYNRKIYITAARKPDPWIKPKPTGRRISPLEIWKEARIDGLMPREVWIPTETRGTGWNYDWKLPSGSLD